MAWNKEAMGRGEDREEHSDSGRVRAEGRGQRESSRVRKTAEV